MAVKATQLPEQVKFDPCVEAGAVAAELAKEPSLQDVACVGIDRALFNFSVALYTIRPRVWIEVLLCCQIAHEVGMTLLVDTTGKLLNKKKPATRKDVLANTRVPRLLWPTAEMFGGLRGLG